MALGLAASSRPGAGASDSDLPPAVAAQLKADFIYTVAKFVEWPPETFADPGAPLVVAVVGEDPLGTALDTFLAGKRVKGRPIEVRRVRNPGDLGPCEVLFVGSSGPEDPRRLLGRVRGRSVLTVSEAEGFARAGGILEIEVRDGLIRFVVNHEAAEGSGLRISSKILSLGRVVRTRALPGEE